MLCSECEIHRFYCMYFVHTLKRIHTHYCGNWIESVEFVFFSTSFSPWATSFDCGKKNLIFFIICFTAWMVSLQTCMQCWFIFMRCVHSSSETKKIGEQKKFGKCCSTKDEFEYKIFLSILYLTVSWKY